MRGSVTERIKDLLLAGVRNCEVARETGATMNHVSQVKWQMRNMDKLRAYQRQYLQKKAKKKGTHNEHAQ